MHGAALDVELLTRGRTTAGVVNATIWRLPPGTVRMRGGMFPDRAAEGAGRSGDLRSASLSINGGTGAGATDPGGTTRTRSLDAGQVVDRDVGAGHRTSVPPWT